MGKFPVQVIPLTDAQWQIMQPLIEKNFTVQREDHGGFKRIRVRVKRRRTLRPASGS